MMFYPKFNLFWEATGDIYRTMPTMMKYTINEMIIGHLRSFEVKIFFLL